MADVRPGGGSSPRQFEQARLRDDEQERELPHLSTLRSLRNKTRIVAVVSAAYLVVGGFLLYGQVSAAADNAFDGADAALDGDDAKSVKAHAANAYKAAQTSMGLGCLLVMVVAWACLVPLLCGFCGAKYLEEIPLCLFCSTTGFCTLVTLALIPALGAATLASAGLDAAMDLCDPTRVCCGKQTHGDDVHGSSHALAVTTHETTFFKKGPRVIECDQHGLPVHDADRPAYEDCIFGGHPRYQRKFSDVNHIGYPLDHHHTEENPFADLSMMAAATVPDKNLKFLNNMAVAEEDPKKHREKKEFACVAVVGTAAHCSDFPLFWNSTLDNPYVNKTSSSDVQHWQTVAWEWVQVLQKRGVILPGPKPGEKPDPDPKIAKLQMHDGWKEMTPEEQKKAEKALVKDGERWFDAIEQSKFKDCALNEEMFPPLKIADETVVMFNNNSAWMLFGWAIPLTLLGFLQCCWGSRLLWVTNRARSDIDQYRPLLMGQQGDEQ